MLSISDPITLGSDAEQYYLDKAKEAYYTDGKVGQWFGGAAKALELSDAVQPQAFHNLLRGFSPDGTKELVKNAGAPNRTAGWDLTFSAPKSVSVLWAMLSESEREEVLSAHRHACKTALKYAEEIWGITRRGKGGKIHERAKLLFATFEEYTSRAQDMQIHTHCLLVNTCVRQDGRTGALHSINFFRAKMILGAIYQVDLASQLRDRRGLVAKPNQVAFSIEGVPKDLCRSNSKRRVAIEAMLEARGLSGAVASKIAALDTRPAKQSVPLKELSSRWQELGNAFGWGPEQAAKLIGPQADKLSIAKSFQGELRNAMTAIPRKDRTKETLLLKAKATAIEQGATGMEFLDAVGKLRLPNGQPLIWRPLQKAEAPRQECAKQEIGVQTENAHVNATVINEDEPGDIKPDKAATGLQVPETRLEEEVTHSSNSKEHMSPGQPDKSEAHHEQMSAEPPSKEDERQRKKEGRPGATTDSGNGRQETAGEKRKARAKAASNESRSSRQEGRSSHRGEKRPKLKKSYRPSRLQRARNTEFKRRFGELLDRILPEKQTRARLTKIAFGLARKYCADRETLNRVLREMRPAAEQSFVHVEAPRVFPKSPIPALKWLRIPKIAIGDKPRKWGIIHWRKSLIIGEIRIQDRCLFPKADRWSPLHGLKIPSLHFTLKGPKSAVPKQTPEPSKKVQSESSRTKSHRQSQSH